MSETFAAGHAEDTQTSYALCSGCREVWPCRPSLLATIEALQAEVTTLRTALEYYAESRNYGDGYLRKNDSYDELKLPGTRAREALHGRE